MCFKELQTPTINSKPPSKYLLPNLALVYDYRTTTINNKNKTKNHQNSRVECNRNHRRDHRLDRRRQGGGRNNSNHCGLPPSLAKDTVWVVANVRSVSSVYLSLLLDSRYICKSYAIIENSFPNGRNCARGRCVLNATQLSAPDQGIMSDLINTSHALS